MASESASTSLCFSVRRGDATLIRPAVATPHEVKALSDIDDQETLRFELPMVMMYPRSAEMRGRDPARVIREALERALVFYYPLAGRLKEGPGRKLMVDCTAEGVLFAEADADVTLTHFYDVPMPPVPCLDRLIIGPDQHHAALTARPLLFIQVTRLRCGGFVFGIRFNHTMCDGPGLVQFLNAVGEMARGASTPSLPPLWARDLLTAPTPTPSHPEYEEEHLPPPLEVVARNSVGNAVVVHRSFFFGPEEMSALRSQLPESLRSSSSAFDILAACIWRCRTAALEVGTEEQVQLVFVMTAHRRRRPYLPAGFYGNAFVFSGVTCSAGRLRGEPLGYAVELIRGAQRLQVTQEYIRSVAEELATRGRPALPLLGGYRTYLAANVTRARFQEVDLGWGRAAYGGPGTCGTESLPPTVLSYYVRFMDAQGADRIVVPIALPAPAMHAFVTHLRTAITTDNNNTTKSSPLLSLL